MFTHSGFRNKAAYFLVVVVVVSAGLFKIADLDFWWHLKTGQIILLQQQFQYSEIYSFTVAGRDYVDHEWLFQVFQYLAYSAGGPAGVIVLKCIVISAIYLLITGYLLRSGLSPWVAVPVLILSVSGARTRFIERPEIYTALFLVVLYLAIDSFLKHGKKSRLIWCVPLMIVWANFHAAVILGLVLQLIVIAGLCVEWFLRKSGYPVTYSPSSQMIGAIFVLFLISVAVSGLNPTGYRVLTVPFELTGLIDSGLLDNQEWRQPPLFRLPFFYACLATTFFLMLRNFRQLHFVNFLLASFLGYISLKYVRNVGLFSIFMPLLITPCLKNISAKIPAFRVSVALICSAIFLVMMKTSPFESGIGVASYFPDQIVNFTKRSNLQGHMLNSYAFGGYFIWTLYPERKIFIDGRNEVYLPLLEEIIRVRADSRLWKNFLEKYGIEYALLNYVDDLEDLAIVGSDGRTVRTKKPFTETHFPRSSWGLVFWDDDGMVFVKRNGLNAAVLAEEYQAIFPEGYGYQESLVRMGLADTQIVLSELNRKLREDPACKRATHLLKSVEGIR